MKKLIIYDSVFGNTEKVARAIGAALSPQEDVSVLRVTEVTSEHLAGLDLLIAGSPTRAFKPTPTMSNFLKKLPNNCLQGVKVTALDTRADVKEVNNGFLTFMVGIFGYAAEPMAKRLVKKGGSLVTPPVGFFITASEGPLRDGEIERAAAWGAAIGKN